MKMVKIETISAETIKPSMPPPSELRTFKISLLDQLAPPLYVPVILFYSATDLCIDNNTTSFDISSHLKNSLSKTLNHYYPLAGRLKGNATVDCNDEGVPFIEAKANLELSEILENPNMDLVQKFLPLDPYNVLPVKELVITAVQVNYFECGGMAIGVCISHKIADGATVASFLSAWSANANGTSEIIVPRLDSASLFPPRDVNIDMPSGVISKEKTLTKRFILDAQKLALLRAKIANGAVTRVEAVTSLIWKSAFVTSQDSSSSMVTHVVNLRARMSPRMHEQFLGNIWQLAVTAPILTKHEESKLQLGELISEIRTSIRKINGNYIRMLQGDDGLLKACESMKEVRQHFMKGGVDCYRFSSWTRFPFYETNFGWGNPTWVCTTNVPIKNVVILMSTKSGDGIEAWVTLAEDHMASFEQDHDLLEFISTRTSP